MKSLFFFSIVSISSFGQFNMDFSVMRSSLELYANSGYYVCKVEPTFSKAPTLGYGFSKNLAKINAINKCITETGNHEMYCDDVTCNEVIFESVLPTVRVPGKSDKNVVFFSYETKTTCIVKAAFGQGEFYAEARSKIEAEVFAQRACMEETGNARFDCELEHCETTQKISERAGESTVKSKERE